MAIDSYKKKIKNIEKEVKDLNDLNKSVVDNEKRIKKSVDKMASFFKTHGGKREKKFKTVKETYGRWMRYAQEIEHLQQELAALKKKRGSDPIQISAMENSIKNLDQQANKIIKDVTDATGSWENNDQHYQYVAEELAIIIERVGI